MIGLLFSGCGKAVSYLADPTSISPANGATNIAVNTIITVIFGETIDPSSVSFNLTSGSGGVSGTVRSNAKSDTITFTPTANLSASTEYTAQISAQAASGDIMDSSYSWSFTTGSSADVSPPEVSAFSPANGATTVEVNTTVTATFSKAMNPLTISTDNFTLSSSEGNVSGVVDYDPLTYKATFIPSSNLTDATEFTATVSGNVEDTFGNKMATPESWSFTVNPAVYAPTFNYASGSYEANILLSIACTTEDSIIYYTDDGTDPDVSTGTEYQGAFTVEASATIKAIAVKGGKADSPIASAAYDIYGWLSVGTGINGTVRALLFDGSDNLYAGGRFSTAGGNSANNNNIAKWNETAWSVLGSGITKAGLTATVYSLGLDSSSVLFAGGDFDTAGGSAAGGLASWEGSAWKQGVANPGATITTYAISAGSSETVYIGGSVNAGAFYGVFVSYAYGLWNAPGGIYTNAEVYALAYDSTRDILYAGGAFTTFDVQTKNYIARWTNSSATWEAMGAGMNGTVYALAYDSTNDVLYAGGDFTEAGSVQANYVAKWDGTSWTALGAGMDKKSVLALAYDSTNDILYAAGSFEAAGGITVEGVAKWDGTSWSKYGDLSSTVYSLALDSSNTLYAGGAFSSPTRIAKWGKK